MMFTTRLGSRAQVIEHRLLDVGTSSIPEGASDAATEARVRQFQVRARDVLTPRGSSIAFRH